MEKGIQGKGKGEEKNSKDDAGNIGNWDSAEMGDLVASVGIKPVNFAGAFFDKSEWLLTKEAAVYLRKFSPKGIPSVNAVHKLVAKGVIRRRKFHGRLYFRKRELEFILESSVV